MTARGVSPSRPGRWRRWAAYGCATAVGAAAAPAPWADLAQLARIPVSAPSKRAEPAWTIPAALRVITPEEMRSVGARSPAEALRLAPGLGVARINAQRFAVGIRGFDNEFNGKVLVMQDGRSVLSPQLGGIFWDAQDTLLADVARIEVVRGPVGAAWGVNAFSGVVNIVSKPAWDTQGTLAEAGGGTFEPAYLNLRYGGTAGPATAYRVWARAFRRGETESAAGAGLDDDWSQRRAGFRVDRTAGDDRRLSLQGEVFGGQLRQYVARQAGTFDSRGWNLLGRWSQPAPAAGRLEAVAYWDATRREAAPATSDTDTFSFDFNHALGRTGRHELTWGLGHQVSRNEAGGQTGHRYDPAVRSLGTWSVAAADRIELVRDRASLRAGLKLERNHFTGWEAMPHLGATWTPSGAATAWATVSRGLQTPALADYDLTIEIPGTPSIRSVPNRSRPLAEVVAWEAGFRHRAGTAWTLDLAAFVNRYDGLPSNVARTDPANPALIISTPANEMSGRGSGAEFGIVRQVGDWCRIRASWALLTPELRVNGNGADPAARRQEGLSARQQGQLSAVLNLGARWSATVMLRYTGSRAAIQVPAYLGADVRLVRRWDEDFELAIGAKDLLDPRHPEFVRSPGFPANAEIPRSFYAELSYRR